VTENVRQGKIRGWKTWPKTWLENVPHFLQSCILMSHSFSVPESFCFMSSRATSQVCHLAVKSDDQQCIPGIIAVQIVFLLLF